MPQHECLWTNNHACILSTYLFPVSARVTPCSLYWEPKNIFLILNFEFETKALERQSEGGALWSSILDNFIQMGQSLDLPLPQRHWANANGLSEA